MNHCVLTREHVAVLRSLSNVYKRPNKKFLGQDFRLSRILIYEHVPPLCMKVCVFFKCTLHVSFNVQYNETSAVLIEDFVALLFSIRKVSI
jgi:hypothetical protein